MSEFNPAPETPKKSNTLLIVGVVLAVLFCCCLVGGGFLWYAWNNGDQWIQGAGILRLAA